jgi:hypothetical protein
MDESERAIFAGTLMDRVDQMIGQDTEFFTKNNIHFSHAVFVHMRCAVEIAHQIGMTKEQLVDCMETILNGKGSKYKGIVKMLKK